MCDICRRYDCVPMCPNYRRLSAVRCENCNELLCGGDAYYQINGKPYCADCVEYADAEDLLRFCETEKDIWLKKMGFEFGWFQPERN